MNNFHNHSPLIKVCEFLQNDSSLMMYPCNSECSETPGLCTYYAITSLMVIILAGFLIWFPFVELISELNLIIAKGVIYCNNQFIGITDSYIINNIEAAFVSRDTLVTISVCCMAYVFYLASSDFLISAACYVSLLPDVGYITSLKQLCLTMIYKILDWKGEKGKPRRPHIVYYEG